VSGTEGTIQIHGLRCRGRQGSTPEERAREHEYLVDVSVVADLGRAIAADDVRSALDISAIAQTVREAVAERPRALVERITADVANALLGRFPEAREVRVRVEKPEPAGLGADAESVELTLRR
jgi:7,8-dihydroneopterin aldolase/epimerase/oxygenase